MSSPGRAAFQLSFDISPIIMTGGVAANIPGSMLPIVSILESANFIDGLLSGGINPSLDDFFAHFVPLPGANLQKNAIGKYPFANQTVAANAIIAQPLNVSLLMICPVNTPGGYVTKLATMTALKALLDQHSASGGLYTVALPTYIYPNGILTELRCVDTGESKQKQTHWQWDFEFPLVTLQQAQQAQSQAMSNITNGLPTDGSSSGQLATLNTTISGAAPSTVSAAQPLSGAGVGTSDFVGSGTA